MLTLKQIAKLLQDKKENHVQLSSGTYYFGDPFFYADSNDIKYPFMGARILDSGNSISNSINGADNVLAIEVFFCDLIKKDDSDGVQTMSDMQIIALDIYSQLVYDLQNYFKANLDNTVTLNPITPAFNNDESIGWSIVLNIRQFYDKSTCGDVNSDTSGKVIVFDQDGNILYTLYPGQTLTIEVLQQIVDTINNNSTAVIDPIQ